MPRLSAHPSAQAYVRITDDLHVILKSYETDVVDVNLNTHEIMYTGLYSATTRKHISWFLKEHFPEIPYSNLRDCPTNTWIPMDTISI